MMPLALMVTNADAFIDIFLVYSVVLISEIKIIVSYTELIFQNREYPFFIFFHFTLLSNDLLVTFSWPWGHMHTYALLENWKVNILI